MHGLLLSLNITMRQRYIVTYQLSRAGEQRATMPRVPRALIALTALAAALRLPTLGSQSLWLDEVLTGNLARGSLGDLFHVVAQQEANPPLFYLVEWVWTRIAGTSEFALRLPSALCGIALVPVGYAIGKRLAGERTAVALAALVAVHPLLVYYSQEARGYSAVALACAVGFLYFLDDRPLGWAIASAVALGCHYFAIFPIAIEAVILLWRGRRAAVAAVVVVGAALLPLLHEQLRGDHADNVTQGVGLATRTKGVVTSWIVGERGAAIDNLEWLGGALLIAGAVLAIRRREALMPALVGGGGAVLMLLTALGGADYINNRNTIAVLAIVLAVPAIGFAGQRLLGAATCVVLLAATIGALIDPAHAREDWRSAARKVTAPVVLVEPAYQSIPLRWYAPELHPVPTPTTRELDVVTTGGLRPRTPTGFLPGKSTETGRIRITRYTAPAPQPVPNALSR
jgi:4-amino-4-deoxy-L-arabinose transferase-like glycosyltransferase